MDNASRFVFSGPSSWPLEQAIRFAVDNGFTRVDFNADNAANYPGTFTPERVDLIRSLIAERGVAVGIHSSSAVNMAEITPVMASAADEYVRQNIELAMRLGGTHVIVQLRRWSPRRPRVPEASTWGLLIAGFGVIGFAMRRRNTGAHARRTQLKFI